MHPIKAFALRASSRTMIRTDDCGHRIAVIRFALVAARACLLSALALGATTERVWAAPAQEARRAVRLLTAAQGREIAAAALAQDEAPRSAQDCSHLVHQVYSDAGYEYSYASSFDLYAGHGNFRRVRHAQTGDLITWPGHVGIVLDPARHSFYSLVRSGLQTEDYLGPYWRSRGRPRFYRYIVETGPEVRAANVTQPSTSGDGNTSVRRKKATTEELAQPERANPNQTASEASLRSKVIVTPPATANDTTAEAVPSSIVITTERRAPTPEEALDGISELSNAAAGLLHTAEPLNVKIPVVVLDELHVERIEIKRDKGWAHLQINSHARIASDGTDFKRRREKVRWELRRDASGWVAFAPSERAYVARDVAVRTLAAQLAEMTQSEAAAQHQPGVVGQEARIANLLSALLQD
jgi:NlpC/P60 family